jgi:hypothetical protein
MTLEGFDVKGEAVTRRRCGTIEKYQIPTLQVADRATKDTAETERVKNEMK